MAAAGRWKLEAEYHMDPTVPSMQEQPGQRGARRVLALAGLCAAGVLVLLYAAPMPPGWPAWILCAAEAVLAALFVVDRLRRLATAPDARAHVVHDWLDLLLTAGAAAAVIAGAIANDPAPGMLGMYVLVSRSWLAVSPRRRMVLLNVLLAATGLAAVGALLLEYGFHEPLPARREFLHTVQTAVVILFVLDRIVRLEGAADRRDYFRQNWVDFALLGAGLAAALAGPRFTAGAMSAGALYVIITQVYILISLIMRGVGVNLGFAGSGIHPTWLLIGSFLLLCLVGSGLLMLPAATPANAPVYYVDALFTSTSAVCVTGLAVRDTGTEFTPMGQAVILGLIQLGGLGITMFGTVLALMVGKGISLRGTEALGQMVGSENVGQLGRVVKFVVAVTLTFEAIGAAMLYPMFAAPQGPVVPSRGQAVWDGVFHSVSAFCNAGFGLYGNNLMQGVREGWETPLREHWQVLGVIAPLIVLGGLGFPVLQDCGRLIQHSVGKLMRRGGGTSGRANEAGSPRPRLSLHSKLVLWTSGVLIVAGAVLLLAVEPQGPAPSPERMALTGPGSDVRGDPTRWRNMPPWPRLREALFTSVTARTAGFNTIDMGEDLSDAGRLVVCLLMVIGGSPASTAGGMKTVTFAVLLIAAWSMVRQRDEAEAFRRSLPVLTIRRALTLGVLYLGMVGAVTLLLCVAMPGWDFLKLLFESCSACGTVGLSANVTPKLTLPGKLDIIAAMFLGRIGPLTLLLALAAKLRPVRYSYPSEAVVIG